MKNKGWIILLAAVFVVCLALSAVLLLPGKDAAFAEVRSDGELIATVDLRVDQEFTVESEFGTNVITVKDGKIAVTQASCPDHYCMDRGFCSSGTMIVCLPNRLVIEFVEGQTVDGAIG